MTVGHTLQKKHITKEIKNFITNKNVMTISSEYRPMNLYFADIFVLDLLILY